MKLQLLLAVLQKKLFFDSFYNHFEQVPIIVLLRLQRIKKMNWLIVEVNH